MESFDLAIVGAGIHGIAMLKTYLEVNPKSSVIVLEKSSCLGGVWAEHRLYPSLRTNNHFGTFEFSDFPMSSEGYDPAKDHIPGEHVNAYLQSYVQKFDMLKYMRFNCTVVSIIDEEESGWKLVVADSVAGTETEIRTMRLVVATGLTSEPYMPPPFEGRDDFDAPVYHTSEFAKANNGLGHFRKVVVLSGGKSSWDVAYAYASSGVQVDWVIPESGHGPCWMVPNRLTPLKIIPEHLLQTRLMTWLSPCVFNDGFQWIRKLLHGTWVGRKFVDAFFGKIEHGVLEHNNYDSHPETAKLKPWNGIFFLGTNHGLLNYQTDIFELVRNGMIRVHISDISKLSRNTVHLADGASLDADVLICGTGWKHVPPIDFVSEHDLGLPGRSRQQMRELISRADTEVFETFPKLREQPKPTNGPDSDVGSGDEPYRLYRFMVPPAYIKTRTLAFAAAYRSPATVMIAQAQALWITAYFQGNVWRLQNESTMAQDPKKWTIKPDMQQRVMYETILHTQFCKWRYSEGFGARFPEIWFDCLPYVDLLLREVGVKNKRKTSWWKEIITPYLPGDYKGIVTEYLQGRQFDDVDEQMNVTEQS